MDDKLFKDLIYYVSKEAIKDKNDLVISESNRRILIKYLITNYKHQKNPKEINYRDLQEIVSRMNKFINKISESLMELQMDIRNEKLQQLSKEFESEVENKLVKIDLAADLVNRDSKTLYRYIGDGDDKPLKLPKNATGHNYFTVDDFINFVIEVYPYSLTKVIDGLENKGYSVEYLRKKYY